MKLVWGKSGELYDRVYTAKGLRGTYRIDLDKIADRWVIYVNDEKCVEDIYYIKNAQRIAECFEANGKFSFPTDLRSRPDGRLPHILTFTSGNAGATTTIEQPIRSGFTQIASGPPQVTKLSFQPDPNLLAEKLYVLITNVGISPEMAGTPWLPWQSGVYALLDCIFSSQSDYNAVVLPLLRRLATRPNLRDEPGLCFSSFLADVDGFGKDKFERYAVQVLTRNKIAGRLKVEICYEAANFFVRQGLETMSDLHRLGVKLEPLILNDLQAKIHGVGPALAHYLLTLFGDEDHVKLDVMITRFWARMNDWCPRASHERDYQIVLATFRIVASRMSSTPARLDNAIWRYESSQARRSI